MSTPNEATEEEKTPDNTVKTAEEETQVEPEEEERERVQWPGAKGEGELRLHFFDIEGLPESLDDETDASLKLMLALVAEIQQLRVENYELKQAVTYMSMEHFMQKKGHGPSPYRPPPMVMHRLASSQS